MKILILGATGLVSRNALALKLEAHYFTDVLLTDEALIFERTIWEGLRWLARRGQS